MSNKCYKVIATQYMLMATAATAAIVVLTIITVTYWHMVSD